MTTPSPAPRSARRGMREWPRQPRAAWWALSGQDRNAAWGVLRAGVLLAVGWRAGHLGLVQADFVLTVLGGLAGVATLCQGALYQPDPTPPPTGPLVAPSQEVQRHAAREAAGPGS
ncbi:hypothetical protein AB0940_29590 [Streptomyces sp. NPDC006656]|uniref:hypothetical protein n=1 Tax=Streptomyces sp. NPDC006656 TaxID=3156899 RepID=UPI00345546F7